MLDMLRTRWSSPLSLTFTAVVVVLLAAGYYWVWCRSRFVRLIDALPGPKPLPLLGNILDVANIPLDEIVLSVSRYNPIYKLWIGFYPTVVIAHPELWKPILSSHKLLARPHEFKFSFPENSLTNLTGESWRERRSLLNPAFHFQILNGFVETFNDLSLDCAAKMEESLGRTGQKEMNVFSIMSKLVLDILCETSMGGKVWSEVESTKFAKGIDVLENIFRQRLIHKPWLRIDWIFKLTSLYRQQKQVLSDTNASVDKVIKNRRQSHRRKAEKHSDQSHDSVSTIDEDSRPKKRLAFLDLLMVKASEENSDMSDEILRNEVSTFMAAGLDSTAVAFNWFLYLIAKHPDHQKLVTDELDLIFGDSDRPVTAHDLTRLKYLECCIKETLRMYPPFPAVSRYLSEDVQSGGYTLPRGVTVVINIFAAHHDPTVFPDPDAFKPERFLPENSVGRHPYAFIPFSAGPRNCIAQKYAMMELKVCLANILRRLKFSLIDPSAPLEIPSPQLLLKPKDGKCNLIVSKRLDIHACDIYTYSAVDWVGKRECFKHV